jgi:hypothetical protein
MALSDSWECRHGISEWEPDVMTICIAAICDHGHAVVLCADREVGIEITSAEMIGKFLPLFGDHGWNKEWAIGIAGTATNATDVIGTVRRKKLSSFPSYDVRAAVEQGYREARLARAEALHLANRGWTLKEFNAVGAARMSAGTYAQIDARIAAFDFNTDLIFAGFGEEDLGPSIMSVTNPGVCTDHTVLGFWCIGSGSTAAQVTLFSRSYSWSFTPEQAVYHIYEAKIAAQKASGVGGKTDIHLMRKHGLPISLVETSEASKVMSDIYSELGTKEFEQKHYDLLRATDDFTKFRAMPS